MTTREGEARPAERANDKAETAPGSELSSRADSDGHADEPAPLTGSVAAPPADARQLRLEIERTREQLGETVQELVARVDVKSRAVAKASELSGKWQSTTLQARRAVTKGADGARQRWVPLAAVAGAVILDCLAVWQWRRDQ
jgi:Protein of unknown function (DUF3618)